MSIFKPGFRCRTFFRGLTHISLFWQKQDHQRGLFLGIGSEIFARRVLEDLKIKCQCYWTVGFINGCRRCMAEILPIRRKNCPINQSLMVVTKMNFTDLFYRLILKHINQMRIQECPKNYMYQYFMIQWRQRYIEYRLPCIPMI